RRLSSGDHTAVSHHPHPCPTRRSSDLRRYGRRCPPGAQGGRPERARVRQGDVARHPPPAEAAGRGPRLPRLPEGQRAARRAARRSEEHTSELQSLAYLVCRLLLEKKKK